MKLPPCQADEKTPYALAIYFHVLPHIYMEFNYVVISSLVITDYSASFFQISEDKRRFKCSNHACDFEQISECRENVLNQSHVKLLPVLFCAKALKLKISCLKVTGGCLFIGPSAPSIHHQWQIIITIHVDVTMALLTRNGVKNNY